MRSRAETVSHAEVAASPARPAGRGRATGILRSHGLRSTGPRAAILDLLITAGSGSGDGSHGHLTAPEIVERLASSGIHVDGSTIYRNLTILAELGVLHATAHTDQPVSYGLAVLAHHHAVCRSCGAVTDVPAERITETVLTLGAQTGFRAADLSVTVHGVCGRCQPGSPPG